MRTFYIAIILFVISNEYGFCQIENINLTPNEIRHDRDIDFFRQIKTVPIDSSKFHLEIRLYTSGFSKTESALILKKNDNNWISKMYKVIWHDYLYKMENNKILDVKRSK